MTKTALESRLALVLTVAAFALSGACGKGTASSPLSPSSTSASSANASGSVEVSGRIATINAPARTLQVATTTIAVPAGASLSSSAGQIEFKDLRVEMQIHVKGTQQGTVVTAQEVQVEDHADPGAPQPNPEPEPEPGDQNETEFTGAIASLGGSCPGLTLTVTGKTVTTNSATAFLKAACGDLRSGMMIEVKGTSQPNGSVLAERVQVDDDGAAQPEPEPGDQGETEFTGSVSSLSGSCPAPRLTVAGRSVTSSASTEFKDSACGDIKGGVMLEVKGLAAKDGSVAATRLKVDR